MCEPFLSVFLSSVLMLRMGCLWAAVLWSPRPVQAPALYGRPISLTVSGGSPSCIAPILTLTFHPRPCPETHPRPVSCEYHSSHLSPNIALEMSGLYIINVFMMAFKSLNKFYFPKERCYFFFIWVLIYTTFQKFGCCMFFKNTFLNAFIQQGCIALIKAPVKPFIMLQNNTIKMIKFKINGVLLNFKVFWKFVLPFPQKYYNCFQHY